MLHIQIFINCLKERLSIAKPEKPLAEITKTKMMLCAVANISFLFVSLVLSRSHLFILYTNYHQYWVLSLEFYVYCLKDSTNEKKNVCEHNVNGLYLSWYRFKLWTVSTHTKAKFLFFSIFRRYNLIRIKSEFSPFMGWSGILIDWRKSEQNAVHIGKILYCVVCKLFNYISPYTQHMFFSSLAAASAPILPSMRTKSKSHPFRCR